MRRILALTVSLPILLTSPLRGQDTLTVTANNPPVWGVDVEIKELYRIGCLEGPEGCSFGEVAEFAVGADGSVYVGDRVGPVIRKFDSTGAYLGSVGRSGEGPGEYRWLSGLATLGDGGFALWDYRSFRISYFDSMGRFTHSNRVTGGVGGGALAADTAGHLYLLGRTSEQRPSQGERYPTAWMRMDSTGAFLDTLPIPPEETEGPSFVVSTAGGVHSPFSIKTLSAWSPHGYLVVGRNSEYAIYRPLADGRTLKIVRDYTPVPVDPVEQTYFQAVQKRIAAGRLGSGLDERPIPKVKPPFKNLWVDADGRIWVGRYAKVESPAPAEGKIWMEPRVLDVLTPQGTFLGTLTLPPEHTVGAAQGDRIWVHEVGGGEEEYVVCYQLRTQPGPSATNSNSGGIRSPLLSLDQAAIVLDWPSSVVVNGIDPDL